MHEVVQEAALATAHVVRLAFASATMLGQGKIAASPWIKMLHLQLRQQSSSPPTDRSCWRFQPTPA